jgi:hypothetical protein
MKIAGTGDMADGIRILVGTVLKRNDVSQHRNISGHISHETLRVRRVLYSQLTLRAQTKRARATFHNAEWEMNSAVTSNIPPDSKMGKSDINVAPPFGLHRHYHFNLLLIIGNLYLIFCIKKRG